jgi:hypothetical protein
VSDRDVWSFPDEVGALAFTDVTRPWPIRFVGRCTICSAGCAQTVAGEWEIAPDLFGRCAVRSVPMGNPTDDPCAHRAMHWERVRVVAGAFEVCNETCRDALGASCACSCLSKGHGSNHRLKPAASSVLWVRS